jgi:hypothetical protein
MADSKDNMTPMKGKSFTERLTIDHNIPYALTNNVRVAIDQGQDPTETARGMLEDLRLEAGFDLGKGLGLEFQGQNFNRVKDGDYRISLTKKLNKEK